METEMIFKTNVDWTKAYLQWPGERYALFVDGVELMSLMAVLKRFPKSEEERILKDFYNRSMATMEAPPAS
jgi:seryl-tRNA(Sec) selenium transferase